MTNKTFRYKLRDLKLDRSMIDHVLGYSDAGSYEHISEIVEGVINEAETICDIKAEYRIFDRVEFISESKVIKVNDIEFNVNKIIYGQIKKSELIVIFLCTAGEEICLRSRKLMKEGDLLRGYIYDVIGSEIVEAAADKMHDELEKIMHASGKGITNRYSPGYCDWDVVEQQKLFRLMPDNFCDISLSESSLMYPFKSVSGIIGTGGNVKRLPYACHLCDMEDCIYRRKKYHESGANKL
jgi:hypothetical protein